MRETEAKLMLYGKQKYLRSRICLSKLEMNSYINMTIKNYCKNLIINGFELTKLNYGRSIDINI